MNARRVLPLLAALLLAACGTSPGNGGAPTTVAPTPYDVTSFLGAWAVTGTDAEPGLVATFDVGELRIAHSCGRSLGSWRASGTGLFVGDVTSWPSECGGRPAVRWLTDATVWAPDGDARVLIRADGTETARLEPVALPSGESLLPLTDELRALLETPTAVPTSLVPATREQLVAHWVVTGPAAQVERREMPGVTFDADGTWRATDGCNAMTSRWIADDAGHLLVTGGASTAVGCSNIDVPAWVMRTAYAGLDGDMLVLVDHAGDELGRLQRAS